MVCGVRVRGILFYAIDDRTIFRLIFFFFVMLTCKFVLIFHASTQRNTFFFIGAQISQRYLNAIFWSLFSQSTYYVYIILIYCRSFITICFSLCKRKCYLKTHKLILQQVKPVAASTLIVVVALASAQIEQICIKIWSIQINQTSRKI